MTNSKDSARSHLTQEAGRTTTVLFLLFEGWFIAFLVWLLVLDWGFWSEIHRAVAGSAALFSLLMAVQISRLVQQSRRATADQSSVGVEPHR